MNKEIMVLAVVAILVLGVVAQAFLSSGVAGTAQSKQQVQGSGSSDPMAGHHDSPAAKTQASSGAAQVGGC